MPFSIVPPPYGPGGGNVTGGGDLNNADRVVIVAGTSEVGESDVTLTTGVFSRAGTVGLAATGANVITFSTNGSERGRFDSTGLGIGVAPTATLSVNGDLGIAALSKLSLGTTGVGGNQFLKYTAANDGIQIDSYGATIFTGGPSNSEFLRILNTGRVLIGTTTDDGSSKLQVAGTATAYSATIYNPTAVTGSTSLVLTPGAGQSTNPLMNVDSGGIYLYKKGRTDVYLLDVQPPSTASGLHVRIGVASTANGFTLTQTAGSVVRIGIDPGTGGQIGFFGVTPVVRQTATDITEVIAALQAYGLLT